jgi:hypothetical protein
MEEITVGSILYRKRRLRDGYEPHIVTTVTPRNNNIHMILTAIGDYKYDVYTIWPNDDYKLTREGEDTNEKSH